MGVLRNFDMGHFWNNTDGGRFDKTTDEVRKSQQTGILFAELCVKLVNPSGRVGIILPNGYLGNGSKEYVALREWILRHTRVVAVVAFPRFTFKKSGADVSASVVGVGAQGNTAFSAIDSEDYPIYFGMIESVGWQAGDKTAKPVYLRDKETGAIVLDEDNNPILDCDFDKVLSEYRCSAVEVCIHGYLVDKKFPKASSRKQRPLNKSLAATSYYSIRSDTARST